MDEKLLFCVSVISGENSLYGPEWKEVECGKTLVDLFLQVFGTKILGQQVQVLVSKDRSFLEAAVVQVCSPLKLLAERSQSYIQFVLKADMPVPKSLFSIRQKEHEKNGSTYSKLNILHGSKFDIPHSQHAYTSWQDNLKSGLKHETFRDENEKLHYYQSEIEPTPLHSLTSKPAFENMTVEEICDEIRKIKSAELSKNKLSSWMEETTKQSKVEDNKQNPPSKSAEKASIGLDQSTATKLQNDKTRTFTKLTESAKNKINSSKISTGSNPLLKGTVKSHISDRLSILAQPRRRNGELIKLNSVNNLSDNRTSKTNSSKTILPKKSGNRRSIPESPKNKVIAKRNSSSPSMTRGSSVNSTFIKTGVKITQTPKSGDKTTTTNSTEYFVEIFTKEKANKTKMKSVVNKKKSDFSTDSLMNQSIDKSRSTETSLSTEKSAESDVSMHNMVSIGEMLTQVHEDTLDSQNTSSLSESDTSMSKSHPHNKVTDDRENFKSVQNCVTPEKGHITSNESSPEEVIFDKNISLNELRKEANKDGIENQKDDSDENLKTIAETILNDTSSMSVEHIVDMNFSLSPTKSPVKTALFSPLLDRNHIQHRVSSTSSPVPHRSKSVDSIQLEMSKAVNNLIDVSKSEKDKIFSKSFDSLEENKEDMYSLSSAEITLPDNVNKECQLETEKTLNKDSSKSTDATDLLKKCSDLLWSNSREINFNGGTDGNIELNRTFVLKDKKIDHKESIIEPPKSMELIPTVNVSTGLKTPDRHRKHWGNSIEGMDSMLIPSLQAFSLELRSTTETVASKIRVLYEDWQINFEGLDASTIKSKSALPKTSPNSRSNGGEQQGIAVIFRNLRKMDVKLKTIEQAAITMVKALEETQKAARNTEKGDVSRKAGIQRTKSFKWTELKNTARCQTSSKKWLKHEKDTSDVSSDSDDG